MNRFHYIVLMAAGVFFSACENNKEPLPPQENPLPVALNYLPEWSKNATMYEVNIRQYSKEGTFNAFSQDLPRLKELGVDILWLMPIQPIGLKNRKGSLGSYYSIQDYTATNPEFGTLDDFKSLVNQAHELGMKVIIDWVANHSAWDTKWISEHPDFYTQDSAGNIIPPNPDWSDVADLNYDNQGLRKEMIGAMKFWVEQTDIDGFRCDVAGEVPIDFWDTAIAELRPMKELFMLAEWDDPKMHSSFNATYSWGYHHVLMEIGKGNMTMDSLRNYFIKDAARYPAEAYRLRFTTNHDENSWKGTETALFGPIAKNFQHLFFVAPGMPLMYSGQESNLDKQLQFFEKDTIAWKTYELAPMFKQLNKIKEENPALWSGSFGGTMNLIGENSNNGVFAFDRVLADNHIRVILNCSDKEQDLAAYLEEGEVYADLMLEQPFAGKTISAFEPLILKVTK